MTGELIKKYIQENGLKLKAIAEKVNIKENTFSAMLSGKRRITAEEYFAICNALNVDTNTFTRKEA